MPAPRSSSALAAQVTGVVALVGFPERVDGRRYNALAVLRDGRVDRVYRKQRLPNYTVFDEERYFAPGGEPCVFDVDGAARRRDHLRGRLVSRARGAGARRRRADPRRPQRFAVPHADSRRRASPRWRRARARRDCRSSTSTGSAARTSWCSTAPRSSIERRRRGRAAVAGLARDAGARRRSTARRPKPVRGKLDPRARAARLRGAGDGRARLRRQEPLSRRAASGSRAASIRR